MRSFLLFACALVAVGTAAVAAESDAPFPGTKSNWNGFDRYDFEVAGKPVLVVCPQQSAAGKPWVWHGEFFGHKPAPDIALLKQGFHVVYMKVPDMLGAPDAVKSWEAFYSELTGKYGFAKKVALVGLSRGGLYCYNWAIANPDKVACIYADAPVCDFKSWPGGKGDGPGSPRDWQLVLEKYGFENEQQALAYQGNPVDQLAPLAKAHVPLLHVYGDADEVVPWKENTGLVAERYRALGGDITLIPKPGVKHHPHGLDDPTPIVSFIALHAAVPTAVPTAAAKPEYHAVQAELVRPREGLGNVIEKLKAGGPVKVAYLGGSITAAEGWRVKSRKWLQEKYPQAKVEEIHAAIGGTGSDLGVFRVERDALSQNPDLLFVEFAVNDGGAAPEQIWRGMEGIVRQTWAKNPRTDICFVYTFAVGQESSLNKGECPRSASAMEQLADFYGIPSINFAKRVVDLQQAGKLIYKSDMPAEAGVIRFSQDGVHPLDEGHQIYQDVIAETWPAIEAAGKPEDHSSKLTSMFVADNWQAAKMVPVTKSMLTGDWRELPNDNGLGKSFSNRMGTIWEGSKPGDKLTFKFRGSQAKLYDLVGPNGGQVIVTVDGKPLSKPIARFDSYCTYHRLATLSVANNTNPDEVHTVVVEIHPEQPDRQPVAFRLKDPETELKSPKFQGTNVWTGQILVLGDVVTE
ncbi:SGNH/GDSL hydrolase family protein [Planctomicrobium piriforme]|uniref:Prolyl oligopeptidase family protein n=1 Tax=Planctomicrobium piriforme TaxID=1576369 RepID=A0A1I3GV79_9PLAN|nr:GDSL-type esterase/lipase family protein [Planctomicrobium piriforme]SFI27475.1 Prolyl oligopeptidase family protein [Planctomicrobium piriforme]